MIKKIKINLLTYNNESLINIGKIIKSTKSHAEIYQKQNDKLIKLYLYLDNSLYFYKEMVKSVIIYLIATFLRYHKYISYFHP